MRIARRGSVPARLNGRATEGQPAVGSFRMVEGCSIVGRPASEKSMAALHRFRGRRADEAARVRCNIRERIFAATDTS
jgi:hypothetical protein